MTDLLRRDRAPITPEAWGEIDDQAGKILRGNLSARALADVIGPLGWTAAAVNLGRVNMNKSKASDGVSWGLRDVQPLLEMKVPFSLSIAELDAVSRGSKTPALDAVTKAAQRAAIFEENAVYFGLKGAGIDGILSVSPNKPVVLPRQADGLPQAVEQGMHAIQQEGIGGPFDLVLGREYFTMLSAGDTQGYPLRSRIEGMIGGAIRWSPVIDGGVVVSARGGDFELTLGQDFSIGFAGESGDDVSLFLTETFTFRVLEPVAATALNVKKG